MDGGQRIRKSKKELGDAAAAASDVPRFEYYQEEVLDYEATAVTAAEISAPAALNPISERPGYVDYDAEDEEPSTAKDLKPLPLPVLKPEKSLSDSTPQFSPPPRVAPVPIT